MQFKTPGIEAFFKGPLLHPDARRAAVDFDHWSGKNGLPEAVVSDLQRSKQRLTETYFGRFKDLRALAIVGTLANQSPEDQLLAMKLKDLGDAVLLSMAKDRFSWHIVGSGIDFSGNKYSNRQADKIHEYFTGLYKKPDWEYLKHIVIGDKPHFHLGRRDYAWKEKYQLLVQRSLHVS